MCIRSDLDKLSAFADWWSHNTISPAISIDMFKFVLHTGVIETGDQNSLNFLLRLQVILAAEQPHLGLSLPHQSAVFARALLLSRWSHPRSKLLTSITNALSEITGSDSHFTLEALTTSLHFIDIEIMLDDRGNPIPVPNHWRSWADLQSLIDSPLLCPRLQDLLRNQVSRREVTEPDQSFSLASDWAKLVGGSVEGVARRVAVEVDGPWHYAANCTHTLGKTLLKHRILRCLGWTVVSVSLVGFGLTISYNYCVQKLWCEKQVNKPICKLAQAYLDWVRLLCVS